MSDYTGSIDSLHVPCKDEDETTWQELIDAAQQQIQRSERRIERLRNAIRIANEQIKAGVPFDKPTLGKKQ